MRTNGEGAAAAVSDAQSAHAEQSGLRVARSHAFIVLDDREGIVEVVQQTSPVLVFARSAKADGVRLELMFVSRGFARVGKANGEVAFTGTRMAGHAALSRATTPRHAAKFVECIEGRKSATDIVRSRMKK